MVSVVHAQVEVTQFLILVKTLFHARKGWNEGLLEWVQVIRGRRPRAEQWPLAPGHRLNRERQVSQQGQHQSTSMQGCSTKISKFVTVVRERRTPEQVRSDASTRVSRLHLFVASVLDTLADGDVEEKRVLQMALVKAQKQAEELPLARQIQVTKDFVDRVRKRMPAADEKIRVATFANCLWPKHVWNGSRRRFRCHDQQHQAPKTIDRWMVD